MCVISWRSSIVRESVLPRAQMFSVMDIAQYTRPFTAVAAGLAYPATRVRRRLRFRSIATGGNAPPQPQELQSP